MRELIETKLASLRLQRDEMAAENRRLVDQLNACEGAIQTLTVLLASDSANNPPTKEGPDGDNDGRVQVVRP